MADVLAKYELEQHELALLREATRTVDDLDALAAVLAMKPSSLSDSSACIPRWWRLASCGSPWRV